MIATQLKKDDFYLPIIRLLDGLGGSASIEEIEQKLIEEFAFTDEDLAVAHEKSGTPIIPNKIAWSRSYLKEAGLLANERRGVWVLTEDGRKALAGGDGIVRERVANAMREYQARRKAAVEANAAEEVPPVEALSDDGITTEEVTDWRDRLLAALKAMDPSAFERLCQRLLRESGFVKVEVTGKSGDGGITGVTRHVIGMDLHPVAVTLARVTYLLAIGRDRLVDPARNTIQIPVYLGDSLQWQEQSLDLWSAGNLTIRADDNRELVASQLQFPDALLDDAARFDELVNELANRAANRRSGAAVPSLNAVFQRLAVPQQHRAVIEGTFRTMCRLHDEGRDHIWGYYVRNLARPMWLARAANRIDVLIGNPPWLAYRHMTTDMQAAFRRMSEAQGLWAGAELATHQDLAGLFAVRACQLYLRNGGRFGLVLPNTAIDREHYRGFRSGRYGDATIGMSIAFDTPWDLRRIRRTHPA